MVQIVQKLINVNFIKGRKRKPCLVVLHIVGKPWGTAGSAYETFKNPEYQRSSHYLTLKDGTVWQFVKVEDIAWTQGIFHNPTSKIIKSFLALGVNPNEVCISIEHE